MNYRLTCYCAFLTLTLTLSLSLSASAQGTKSPSRSPSTTTTNTTRVPTQPNMTPPDISMGQRAFITGEVVLDDGTGITESAAIQTLCQGRRQTVTHTDSPGGFSFEFGDRNSAAMAGVSEADSDSSWSPASGSRGNQRHFRNCELQAALPEVISQPIDLASKMTTFESTDVGRLVLHRVGAV